MYLEQFDLVWIQIKVLVFQRLFSETKALRNAKYFLGIFVINNLLNDIIIVENSK